MKGKQFLTKIKNFFANNWKKIKDYWSTKKRNFKRKASFLFASLITAIISLVYSGVLNDQALQTLVQAEATMLGFFGIFFIYALTKYDDRIKECENNLGNCEKSKPFMPGVPMEEHLMQLRGETKDRKKDLFHSTRDIGICLTASMLISVWLIGALDLYRNPINFFNVINIDIIGFLSYMTLTLFLISLIIFFTIMKDLANEY